MAAGSLVGLVNAADITISSQTLGTASAFAVVLTANQYAAVDCFMWISLPANHGGLKVNWLVPSRLDTGAWPMARIRYDWDVTELNSESPASLVPCAGINDPMHTDAALIVRPGGSARQLRITGSCSFKAPAGGGTVNLQAALAGAGANVTVLANSQVEYRVY